MAQSIVSCAFPTAAWFSSLSTALSFLQVIKYFPRNCNWIGCVLWSKLEAKMHLGEVQVEVVVVVVVKP